MNGISVCAGIGGLDRGVEQTLGRRLDACLYVERELGAAAILAARMASGDIAPGPIWDDVATAARIPGLEAFRCDVITAGIPCQPFSVAGKQQGLEDERWLGESLLDLVGVVGPELVVVENVPGFAAHGAARIAGGLSELGFDAEWDVFSAAAVGAPHRRARFFMVAWRVPDPNGAGVRDEHPAGPGRGAGRAGAVGARGDVADAMQHGPQGQQQAGAAPRATVGGCSLGNADGSPEDTLAAGGRSRGAARESSGNVAYADSRRLEGERGSGILDRERPARGNDSHRRCVWTGWPPPPSDAEGWRAWIESGGPAPATESGIRRGADGLAGRVDRLRALGNAVVPMQAAYAITALLDRAGVVLNLEVDA